MEHLAKPNQSTKTLEARNCNNEKEQVFPEDFKMKPKSPEEKVSINSHEVPCTQNAYLPVHNYLSNLTNKNSNLHQVRINNPSRIIFGQININSIRNKFEKLTYIVNNDIDISMLSETKLDVAFPVSRFLMQGYSTPFRKDQTSKGGGIFLCQRRYLLQNN